MKPIHGLSLSAFTLCAGLVFSKGFTNDIAKLVSMAAIGAIPTGFITYLVTDTRAQKLINQAESQTEKSGQTLHKVIRDYENSKSSVVALDQLLSQLKDELKEARNTINNLGQAKLQAIANIAELQSKLSQVSLESQKSKQQIEYLQAEVEQWEFTFESRLEAEANKRFQIARHGELEKIYHEHDSITSETMALFRRLQSWAEKVAHGHASKAEIIKSLATAYNQNLDEVGKAIAEERQTYLEQIELLNERIGYLQRELIGDLVEPQYGQFGFDTNGQIANEIARLLFFELHLPLAVRGFQVKPDGVVDVGYGYSRSVEVQAVVEAIKAHSPVIVKKLGLFKITSVRKLEITDCIVVSYRMSAAIKADEIKLIVGSPEEFINYITAHPIRYRLIADPGTGKTPTTAVMVSEILKVGGTRGNTGKGARIENVLVNVSCPDVLSSQKDADYPLELFLKYGDTTAAIKSFDDAIADWVYRKHDTNYASQFFQLWVWDELDNTLDSSSDPLGAANDLKKVLKQAHHTGVGWIVSGQSVMTKQLPGFTNDDRSLFTEIIIGIPKIIKYLQVYGKGRNSESNLSKLAQNLEAIEEYVESKNRLVTDDARLLRVALVVDSRSPKLYFLPNLDAVSFNTTSIENTQRLAETAKRSKLADQQMTQLTANSQKPCVVSTDQNGERSSNLTMQGGRHSGQIPHCPHCGTANISLLGDGRYTCKGCKKRFVQVKAVWK